jgi:hypothetical protein
LRDHGESKLARASTGVSPLDINPAAELGGVRTAAMTPAGAGEVGVATVLMKWRVRKENAARTPKLRVA